MKMSKVFFGNNSGTRLKTTIVTIALIIFYSMKSFAEVQIGFDGPPQTITGRINVGGNTTIGSPISPVYTSNLSSFYVGRSPDSPTSHGWLVFQIDSSPVNGFNDVYATNVPGVGVRYTITPSSNPAIGSTESGPQSIVNGKFTWHLFPPTLGAWPGTSVTSSVQFIKTGNITGNGPATTPQVRVIAFSDATNGGQFTKPNLYNASTVNFINYTCFVPAPPAVMLPTVPSSAFSGVGSTAGETSFTISAINCTGNVQFKLTFKAGINFRDPSISLLENTYSGSVAASGYGIQIVDNNRNVINASTKTFETTTDSNNFSQAFLARYYRYNTAATSGIVQSALVYTLDYY